MSTLKVNALNNGGSAIDFPNSLTLGGNPIEQGYTSSATEPTSPNSGDLWWDSANNKLYQYIASEFKELTLAPPAVWYGDRGLFAGKVYGTDIDYVDITTTGNATDFGDLANNGPFFGSVSDSTYGVMGGGQWSGAPTAYLSNVIQYVTISTTGNASDFGDLTRGVRKLSACGDGTYGVFSGGEISGGRDNVMEYITIQTTGNSSDFGDMLTSVQQTAACGNATYGVFAGGYTTTTSNVIEYVTIATPGNSQDFGDLTQAQNNWAGLSDDTRGLFAGGSANVIDYITVSTPANASDFGDQLSLNGSYESGGMMSCANSTRGVWGGGFANGEWNTIQYVTIQTLGNAADFGDLTVARYNHNGGFSGSP